MTAGPSGALGAPGRPSEPQDFGLPAGDPLAARLFPSAPGVVKWGLDRTERLLAGVGNPERAYPVLHVGGTNGKGSVARIWAAILRSAGIRTGLYTSPHLISFRERIQVDGRPPPDALLEAAAEELRPLVDRESASFFEASTALAFLAMARAGAEVGVVEVGLGGRLDTTNVVRPVLTVITNVAVEHRAFLGDTVEAIAREKAGILKEGVPAFTAEDDPAALGVLEEEARGRGAPLHRMEEASGSVSLDGIRLTLETERWGVLELASPLLGRHQLRNVALAVRALEAASPGPIPAEAVRRGVAEVRIPGRLQLEREGDRHWLLDVAHNPAAARALAAFLDEVELPGPRVGLVGILKDKDWGPMLRELAPRLDALVLTVPDSAPRSRRWDPERAADEAGGAGARAVPSFAGAVAAAREAAGAGGSVVVAGSFHTVGDALRHLDRVPPDALPLPADFG